MHLPTLLSFVLRKRQTYEPTGRVQHARWCDESFDPAKVDLHSMVVFTWWQGGLGGPRRFCRVVDVLLCCGCFVMLWMFCRVMDVFVV